MVWLQHITPPYCDHSSGQIIIYGQGWKQTQNFHSSLCFSIWICSGILKPRFANKKLYHERRYNNDTLNFSFHLWKMTFHNISSKISFPSKRQPSQTRTQPQPVEYPVFPPEMNFPQGIFKSFWQVGVVSRMASKYLKLCETRDSNVGNVWGTSGDWSQILSARHVCIYIDLQIDIL